MRGAILCCPGRVVTWTRGTALDDTVGSDRVKTEATPAFGLGSPFSESNGGRMLTAPFADVHAVSGRAGCRIADSGLQLVRWLEI